MNKPFYIIFFLLLFCCEAKTQTNLVYNGDFEIFDTCPISPSQPGDYQIEHCLGWYTPTYATSDYYNVCGAASVGVPVNGFGYQIPFSGNAYCGILIQYCSQPSCDGWWIEYIQTKLISPLIANTKYEFSYRVVMSDLGMDYYFWKLGAFFSNNNISLTTNKPFTGIIPQILNSTNNYLSDTLNWVEIKGEFIAQGGEQYVTIGYFPDTLSVDTLRSYTPFTDLTNFGNYYFIDDVKLFEKECIQNIPNIFTPNKDDINDVLIFTICDIINKTTIYNRWGIKIFDSENVNHFWDGRTSSGEECDDGTYFYIIETEKSIYKGFVQLIR